MGYEAGKHDPFACLLKESLRILVPVIRIANNHELAIEIGRPKGPAQVVKPFFRNEPTYRDDVLVLVETKPGEDVMAAKCRRFRRGDVGRAVRNEVYLGGGPREAPL